MYNRVKYCLYVQVQYIKLKLKKELFIIIMPKILFIFYFNY